MSNATPALRTLRIRTGIKPGPWAERVQMHPKSYSGVEAGRRTASPEFFARCATLLTEILGTEIDPQILMTDPDGEGEDEHEHTDAGTGPPNRGDSTGPGRLRPTVRAAS